VGAAALGGGGGGGPRRSGATRATRPAAAIDIVDVGGLVC
jgi:hypothetical protein